MTALTSVLIMAGACGALVVYLLTRDDAALVVCLCLAGALAMESDEGRA